MKLVALFFGVFFIAVSGQFSDHWGAWLLLLCGGVLLAAFVYGDLERR